MRDEQVAVALQVIEYGRPQRRELAEHVGFEHGRGAQRQQADERAHLQSLPGAVGEAEDVVEEAVLLVPHLVRVLADRVDRPRRSRRSAQELQDEVLVGRVAFGEDERQLEHVLAEQRHPRSAVGLLEAAAGRQRCAAVEHADVVEPEEPALEDAAAARVLAVDPPREVEEQLVERLPQEREVDVVVAAELQVEVVHEQRGERVHRWVDVAEVPLVGRDLPARVQVRGRQHQVELSLGEVGVDHHQRDRVERQVPRRVPRVLPLVGHRDHVVVDHVEPRLVAGAVAAPVSAAGATCARAATCRGRSSTYCFDHSIPASA